MNISVAIIGSGSMGRRHTYAYDRLNEFCGDEFRINKKIICSRKIDDLRKANEQLGWQECITDWRDAVSRPDIDAVDISTPDHLHYEIARTAIENGKHVICEKPLVVLPEEAAELIRLAALKGVSTATVFNYRYFPTSMIAKRFVDTGIVGDLVHINGSFIMDWAVNPDVPMFWRLDEKCCPLGVLGDLGSHLIDLTRFMGLEFDSVSGASGTVVKERKQPDNGFEHNTEHGQVKNDDITVFTASFKNGAVGNYEVSRVSGGRRRGFVFEIHGTKGNIKYGTADINRIWLSIGGKYGENGEYKLYDINDVIKYAYPWSSEGEFVQADSFTLLIYDFLNSINNPPEGWEVVHPAVYPTFRDGYEACRVVSTIKISINHGVIAKLCDTKSIVASGLTESELNAELEKGFEDFDKGKVKPASNVFSDIRKKYSNGKKQV